MPRYFEVVAAVSETATKILALRGKTRRNVVVTTEGGKTASVGWRDGDLIVTLNMPTLPPDSVLSRAEADRLVAFIGHECCHVLHTQRDAWDKACRDGARVRDWTNALDDVRIERKEIKAGYFPALQSLLSTMANHLHFEALQSAGKAGVTIGARVTDAPYIACILGRVKNGYTIPVARDLEGSMSDTVAPIVRHALAGIRQCRDTWDVVKLAHELVAMEPAKPQLPPMPRLPQPPQPDDSQDGEPQDGEPQDGEPQDGEPQDGQDGQDGDGEPQDSQEGDSTTGEPQDGQDSEPQDGQDGEPQDGEGADSEPCDHGEDGAGERPGISPDADLQDTIEKIAKRAGIEDITEYQATEAAHKLSVVQSSIADRGARVDAMQQGMARQILNDRLPRNSVLHGQIARLLVSPEIRRRTHHESSGRLDRRALSRLQAGARDVYSRREDTPGADTALLILIDASISMRTAATIQLSRMDMAQATAWHIARAAEAANARVAIASFHTPRHGMVTLRDALIGATGAKLLVAKPWHLAAADSAYAIADISPGGSTPLSAAIVAGAGMLAEQNATRHILLVLTDGECDLGPAAVTKACQLAADRGVEVVGVGMACAAVAEAFPPRYSVNVEDLQQLAAKGLGVLVNMLEDANPREGD